MELSEKVENIGGAGGVAGGGSWMGMIFIVAIFFIMLLVLCRNGDGRGEVREGCADKLTWARYANYVDPELTRNHIDQCRDTGQIRKDLAVDNGNVLCAIDKQTGSLLLNQEKATNSILMGQNVIAREQERMFYQAEINRKDEKLAEQRERAVMLEGRLLAADQAREADRRQAELLAAQNAQYYSVSSRLSGIECSMVKAPTFYPLGGIQSVNACPPYASYAGSGYNGCGTCA